MSYSRLVFLSSSETLPFLLIQNSSKHVVLTHMYTLN